MSTGFTVSQPGNYTADLDDILMRREYLNRGDIWTAGENDLGQLGNLQVGGSSFNRSSPGTIAGSGVTWKEIAGGSQYAAVIKQDGSLWTWGENTAGVLGDGTTLNRSSPTSIVGNDWAKVSAGLLHTAAIKTDGTLWTWGRNNNGQLGAGNTVYRSSPGTVSGGGTNWKQVSCGYNHIATIKTDGTLWSWGAGSRGQIGNLSTAARSSPVEVSGGGTNWKQVSACSYSYTAAIKTDGSLWTWGNNDSGQLGIGNTINRSSPVTVEGNDNNWKEVNAVDATLAIKNDGTLWTWGANNWGQVGSGTTVYRSSPVTIAGGGANWKNLSSGYRHSSAIKTDGSLWVWGINDYGQLATNDTVYRSSPVTPVGVGRTWIKTALNRTTFLALTENGP
jgi:alpha-tubulin suppressor-like RCC1 family protein